MGYIGQEISKKNNNFYD